MIRYKHKCLQLRVIISNQFLPTQKDDRWANTSFPSWCGRVGQLASNSNPGQIWCLKTGFHKGELRTEAIFACGIATLLPISAMRRWFMRTIFFPSVYWILWTDKGLQKSEEMCPHFAEWNCDASLSQRNLTRKSEMLLVWVTTPVIRWLWSNLFSKLKTECEPPLGQQSPLNNINYEKTCIICKLDLINNKHSPWGGGVAQWVQHLLKPPRNCGFSPCTAKKFRLTTNKTKKSP